MALRVRDLDRPRRRAAERHRSEQPEDAESGDRPGEERPRRQERRPARAGDDHERLGLRGAGATTGHLTPAREQAEDDEERERGEHDGVTHPLQRPPCSRHEQPGLAADPISGRTLGIAVAVVVALHHEASAVSGDDPVQHVALELGAPVEDDVADLVRVAGAREHEVAGVEGRLHARPRGDHVGRAPADLQRREEDGGDRERRSEHGGGGEPDEACATHGGGASSVRPGGRFPSRPDERRTTTGRRSRGAGRRREPSAPSPSGSHTTPTCHRSRCSRSRWCRSRPASP